MLFLYYLGWLIGFEPTTTRTTTEGSTAELQPPCLFIIRRLFSYTREMVTKSS